MAVKSGLKKKKVNISRCEVFTFFFNVFIFPSCSKLHGATVPFMWEKICCCSERQGWKFIILQ